MTCSSKSDFCLPKLHIGLQLCHILLLLEYLLLEITVETKEAFTMQTKEIKESTNSVCLKHVLGSLRKQLTTERLWRPTRQLFANACGTEPAEIGWVYLPDTRQKSRPTAKTVCRSGCCWCAAAPHAYSRAVVVAP
jgi:hypothetical protein